MCSAPAHRLDINGERRGRPNLAPYSQFQNLNFDPPYVMFAANQTTDGHRKDTTVNAEQTREFVYNMATYALRKAVDPSAEQVPPGVDEFELAGLTKVPSRLVKPPRVKESPVQFECRYHMTLRLPGNRVMGTVDIIIEEVIGIHIDEAYIRPDGKLDMLEIRPLARMGYYDYTSVESVFEMLPDYGNEKYLVGLEGKKQKEE